jgi:hypothetical protein
MSSLPPRLFEMPRIMREHGLDGPTCEQIDALAAMVLSKPSLRNRSDHRAGGFGELLRQLERRIESMLTREQEEPLRDRLAAIKAMSDEERIALFS